ncbi:MAG: alkyl/aryl-sulfatase [Mailhella sp.]|nr:alkyl/aryl-sulfatase [Mailhella sp.]
MLGEDKLRQFAAREFHKDIIRVNGRIACFTCWGHSNVTVIEGDTSLILVDSLESDARMARVRAVLAARTDKPVRTLIFTHGHPDHTGGSGALRGEVRDVIAHAPVSAPLPYYDRIGTVLGLRTGRQFGYALPEEELITQGLGPKEGRACGDGKYDFLTPTEVLSADRTERVIDGVRMVIGAAPGETDDHLFVWLPDDKVLCCGDTYYSCWPNLYAIRGSQYRNVAAWISSLDALLGCGAEVLLPGHMLPLFGADTVRMHLTNYRDAIRHVLFATLDCIDKGMTMSEAAGSVRLPEKLRSLPYLGEYYGTVAWSVKGIYAGYLGWFDGRPEDLDPVPEKEWAEELIALAGGKENIAERIRALYSEGKWQKGLQLCSLLNEARVPERQLYVRGLRELARLQTSANGRHFCQVCADDCEASA